MGDSDANEQVIWGTASIDSPYLQDANDSVHLLNLIMDPERANEIDPLLSGARLSCRERAPV